MAHFCFEAGEMQVHVYCRDQETYEELFDAVDHDHSIMQIRPGVVVPPAGAGGKYHFFLKGRTAYAVNLDSTAHSESVYRLPETTAQILGDRLPFLDLPADGNLQTAPFAAAMLEILTDF